jgi:hypothetical protein
VSAGGALRVISIANPAAPVEVGAFDIQGGAGGVALAGSYAHVASSGLHVISIANPAAPVEVGFYGTLWDTYRVALVGDLVCGASADHGLLILRFDSDPTGD